MAPGDLGCGTAGRRIRRSLARGIAFPTHERTRRPAGDRAPTHPHRQSLGSRERAEPTRAIHRSLAARPQITTSPPTLTDGKVRTPRHRVVASDARHGMGWRALSRSWSIRGRTRQNRRSDTLACAWIRRSPACLRDKTFLFFSRHVHEISVQQQYTSCRIYFYFPESAALAAGRSASARSKSPCHADAAAVRSHAVDRDRGHYRVE
nr:unnamed protein product [Digitaria exilis]